jgi:hypothetical protein
MPINDARELFWTYVGSTPAGAGIVATFAFFTGRMVASRSSLLGVATGAYLAWAVWGVASQGLTNPFGPLTPADKRNLAIVMYCLTYIVGLGTGLVRSLRGEDLTLQDVGSETIPINDQRAATRIFNAARNTYEQFCATYQTDDLELSDPAALQARQDPQLAQVERRFRQIDAWCRTQKMPGRTAAVLDQLAALYLRQGRYDDARKCFDEAGEIYDSLPNTDRSMIRVKGSFHYRLGVLEYRARNFTVAAERFEQALREAEASGSRREAIAFRDAVESCRKQIHL